MFLLLKSSLGAQIDGLTRTVIVRSPRLPTGLQTLSISGLDVGGEAVDLVFDRHLDGVAVSLSRDDGVVTLVHS